MAKSSEERLLEEVEIFLSRTGMSPTAFGVAALRDRHLVKRLRGGASVTLRSADRIDDFMSAYDEKHFNGRGELTEA